MRICYCTLSLTNPTACRSCPMNNDSSDIKVGTPYQWTPYKTPVTKTITEKFDENGKLIERIITESN